MKKTLLAALLSAALAAPFAAQAETSYVGVNLGQSSYKDFGPLSNEAVTGASLVYGFAVQPNFDVELGYIHHGKVSNTVGSGANAMSSNGKTETLYAAAVGKVGLTDAFSIHGKLGAAVSHTKAEDKSPSKSSSASVTKLNPMLGAGLSYQFSKEWSAAVEYLYFPKPTDGNIKLQMWTVGARYHF